MAKKMIFGKGIFIFPVLMPKEGVEPSPPCGDMILSHACMPFHHFGD